MKRKFLSTILAIAIFAALLPTSTIFAGASGSITRDQVLSKLISAETIWGNKTVYDDSEALCKQCYGFSRELFYYIFKASLPTLWDTKTAKFAGQNYIQNIREIGHLSVGYSLSDIESLLLKAAPGDVLIASTGTRNHSVIIRSVPSDGSGIYVYDANWNHANGIRTNAFWSAKGIRANRPVAVTVYRFVNYAVDNSQPSLPVSQTFTVTFNPNGGTVSQKTKTMTAGSEIGTMPVPTRDGYSFLYWSTVKSSTGMIVNEYNYTVDQNLTLYAQWEKIATPPPCNHTYVDDNCSICGEKFPIDNEFNSSAAGKYVVTADRAYVRTGPYQSKSEVYRFNKGYEIDIVGSVINSYNHKWLKTSDGYYTHADKLERAIEQPLETKITFHNLTTPGNLTVGEGGHIDGSITSSNSPICSVKAEVLDRNGNVCLTASTIGFNLSTYGPIKNSRIDNNLTFGRLPVGEYYIKYTAVAKDNTTASAETSVFCVSKAVSTTPAGHWGNWSSWSTNSVSTSNTREVETRTAKVSDGYTEYRYGGYVTYDGKHDCWCETYLRNKFGSATLHYSDWSTTRYSPNGKGWSCGSCGGNHMGVSHYGSDGRAWWSEYVLPDDSYYWEESRTVDAQYETQYRYRDWISG